MSPNLQERLCAAAFSILTDDYGHSHAAQLWALRTLRESGGQRTAFQREREMRGFREMRGKARPTRIHPRATL